MNITLESLGLSVEQMQDRLVEALIDRFLTSNVSDEDGEPVAIVSKFQTSIREAILTRVDESVERLIAPALDGSITSYIDNYKIQSTNGYGEPKREPETITEYIIRRANEYLTEGVNFEGKSKKEYSASGRDSYGYKDATTRVAFLIDKRLNDEIAKAMQEALKTANEAITGGLKSAVAFELNKINAKLKAA
ncbi:hypothetical protein [Caulobacter sp. RHG1]|uniref:hypothetical protein n=1 Tax=Caulobacter sp. (strain RHG1) TaxID=2545762 RepID=UPI0015573994|nr:hypothetical protein [Caulobacter sp. RHG1]NQE62982.1 hypothetical protein [Caulobacter sp. RHG1]